jgi:hypothetical protein
MGLRFKVGDKVRLGKPQFGAHTYLKDHYNKTITITEVIRRHTDFDYYTDLSLCFYDSELVPDVKEEDILWD